MNKIDVLGCTHIINEYRWQIMNINIHVTVILSKFGHFARRSHKLLNMIPGVETYVFTQNVMIKKTNLIFSNYSILFAWHISNTW